MQTRLYYIWDYTRPHTPTKRAHYTARGENTAENTVGAVTMLGGDTPVYVAYNSHVKVSPTVKVLPPMPVHVIPFTGTEILCVEL